MRAALAALLGAAFLAGCGRGSGPPPGDSDPGPELEVVDLTGDPAPLIADFRADSGLVRALIIGGPT